MKKIVIILITFISAPVWAQNDTLQTDSSVSKSALQFSICYPIGSDGRLTKDKAYKTSINLISGINSGVDGFEASGFSNITRGDVRGFQGAGFSNMVKGNVSGYQAAGFININAGSFKGLQNAGFANMVKRDFKGSQMAGFMNYCGKSMKGTQFAGFTNIVGDTMYGAQFAGFGNFAKHQMGGVQIAGFMNLADTADTQISGFINMAKYVRRSQVGFLNICDSTGGVPIGFLSIVRNGYKAFELETNEMLFLNANVKFGVKEFYNIFTLGATPKGGKVLWTFGYGFGRQIFEKNNLSMNIDLTSGHVNEGKWWTDRINLLNQLKFNFAYKTKSGIKIYGGPNISYVLRKMSANGKGDTPIDSLTLFDVYHFRNHDFDHSIAIGFNAGVRF